MYYTTSMNFHIVRFLFRSQNCTKRGPPVPLIHGSIEFAEVVDIWKSKYKSKQIPIDSLWIVSSKFYSGTICWPFNLHNSKKGHRHSPCNVTHNKNVNMLDLRERQNLLKITFMIYKAKITPIFKIMLEKDLITKLRNCHIINFVSRNRWRL